MTLSVLAVAAALLLFPVALWTAATGRLAAAPVLWALSAAFGAFTLWPLLGEQHLLGLWAASVADGWSAQVLVDLGLALTAAVMLAAPRARAAGMNPWPWAALVACTGSIGLFAFLGTLIAREHGVARPSPQPA